MKTATDRQTDRTTTAFQETVRRYLTYVMGLRQEEASAVDLFKAIAFGVRDRIIDAAAQTRQRYHDADAKHLYYLSMEFLIGRSLNNNLINLGMHDPCRRALADMGIDLEAARDSEMDAALGNGGLGRLAACFLDSLATLDMPGYGYGINYEFGLFKQTLLNGYQTEKPDRWLGAESPWLIERTGDACLVPVYGRIEDAVDRSGEYNPMWLDWNLLVGIPYDMPIVGYGGRSVNFLRLFSARASDEFDMQIFNQGDYFKAVEQKMKSETVSKVLYPPDSVYTGKELRLIQEYFLVACAVRDIVRRYLKTHATLDGFAQKVAIQLNDTHPALTVAELMRILVDEHALPWERAWEITRATLGYTNHTLMPEALEKWPVSLFETILPRHLQLIYEINRRFLDQVTLAWPNDSERLRRMSIIEEGDGKKVRMANLSIVGSHSVNGVARLHSELLKKELLADFFQLWPEKFNNKTNGITPRRWLLACNPELAALVSEAVGDGWVTDLERLHGLEPLAADGAFQEAFLQVKRRNKERLAALIAEKCNVTVSPDSLFDVQAKRLHEYKRQTLNILGVMHEYLEIIEGQKPPPEVPVTHIFAGKAAPEYLMAKLVIKLINAVAEVVNKDPAVRDRIKIVFIPDYRVSLAERIVPAADLSEQISTAGMEASGTGNMKFALNGALTIGTLDGANIEIREEVGADNIYIFGLTVEQIRRMAPDYRPFDLYHRDADIRRVLLALSSDRFCRQEPGRFHPLSHSLLERGDYYFNLADFPSYVEVKRQALADFLEPSRWAAKAILNVARMGKFSSDRVIREYAQDIWDLHPVP